MSEAAIPARPNLDWYRKAAKQRLRQLRAKKASTKLAEAHLAVAKEHGFKSWRDLQKQIEQRQSATTFTDALAAIRSDDAKAVAKLLKSNRALANARDEHGESILAHAVEHNRPAIVKLLLDHGADTTARYGNSSHTPLSWAMTVGAFDAANVLLKAGVKPDLFCAAGLGAVDHIERAFDARGYAKPGVSETGATRYADGKRLPSPPIDSVELASDALYIAARNGQIEAIKVLLTKRVDVHFRAYMGGTPLHWAHFNGSREVIDALFAAGADPRARDDVMRATPRAFGICVPSSWGIPNQVKARLKEDPTLANIADARGTPLHEAARNGHVEIVRTLLLVGAKADVRDTDGKLPIDLAREKDHSEVIAVLSESAGATPATPPAQGKRPLPWKPIMDAAFVGDVAKLKRVLKEGADPNVQSTTPGAHRPLHRAIERKKTSPRGDNHVEAVRVLLEAGADPKLRGTYSRYDALELAAVDGPQFVPLLVDAFKPLDIFHACVLLDRPRVTALLKKDESLATARNDNNFTPLHYVAISRLFEVSSRRQADQLAIAQLLIDAGADVNATYPYTGGDYPIPVLYMACGAQNNPALTEMLLKAGAVMYDGESVYHASDECHKACLAVLEKYADPRKLAKECTWSLSTQLHWGHTRGMPWLLAHGADPNFVTKRFGTNALHEAALQGASEKVIAMLLKHGGDPKIKNAQGLTAIEVAKRAGKTRVVEQLTRHR